MSITRTRKDYINQLEREIAEIEPTICALRNQLGLNVAYAVVDTIGVIKVNADQQHVAQQQAENNKTQNKNRQQALLNKSKTNKKVPELRKMTYAPVRSIPDIEKPVNDTKNKHEQDAKDPALLAKKQEEEAKKLERQRQLEAEEKKAPLLQAKLKEINKEMEKDVAALLTDSNTYLNHLTEENTCWWTALNFFTLGIPALIHFIHHSIVYADDKSTKFPLQTALKETLTADAKTAAEKLDAFEETIKTSSEALSSRRVRWGFSSIYDGIATLFRCAPGQSKGKDFCNKAEAVLAKTNNTNIKTI